MRTPFLLLSLVTMLGCGGSAPRPVSPPPSEAASPPPPSPGAEADRRWAELQDTWQSEQRAATDAADAAYTELSCTSARVGTTLVGWCRHLMDHETFAVGAWIVADEGVLALSDAQLHLSRMEDGSLRTRDEAAPVLGGDPRDGAQPLQRGERLLGIVTLGAGGPAFVDVPRQATFSDGVCGRVLFDHGAALLDVVTRFAPDGSVAPRGACEDALEAIEHAAHDRLTDLDTRLGAAALALRPFDAPSTDTPACARPTAADLARAQRFVLRMIAEWRREDAAEARALADEPADEMEAAWASERPPPVLTPAAMRAALASARTSCVDPTTHAFLLELAASSVSYAGVWRITPGYDDARELFETRGGSTASGYEEIDGALDVDLTGDGQNELVVVMTTRTPTDQSTGDECETSISVLSSGAAEPIFVGTAGCETTVNLSIPYALLAPAAGDAHAGLWIDGHMLVWNGTEMAAPAAESPFAAIATAAAAQRDRVAASTDLAALLTNDAGRAIACGAPERDAWASDVAAVLVRFGLAEAEARARVEAVTRCP